MRKIISANSGLGKGNGGWDDWQMEKSVLECNRHMLENQLECDVKFTFLPPEGSRFTYIQDPSISAHKYMLISRSPVFLCDASWTCQG